MSEAESRLLKVGGSFYKPWASKSSRQGYICCKWCHSEFMTKNACGKKGHEMSETHLKNAKIYNEQENQKKEDKMLPSLILKKNQITLFEYRLLNFCISIFSFF